MQLGTRWDAGGTPPGRLPDDFLQAIAAAEKALAPLPNPVPRWTLTWLEGQPIAELDDGTTVRRGPDGVETVAAVN